MKSCYYVWVWSSMVEVQMLNVWDWYDHISSRFWMSKDIQLPMSWKEVEKYECVGNIASIFVNKWINWFVYSTEFNAFHSRLYIIWEKSLHAVLRKPWSHEYGKATKKGLGKWEKRALVFKAQNWFHAVPWVLMTCAVWRISWGAKNQVKNGRECRLHCLAACCQPQLHTIHSLHGTQKRENVEGFSQELLMG